MNGIYIGNIDVRHANPRSGSFKLVIVVHGYLNDKFKIDIISLGDLVLASQIFDENKGMIFFLHFISLYTNNNFFMN